MRLMLNFLVVFFSFLLVSGTARAAQCVDGAGDCAQIVPHFVKFNGVLKAPFAAPPGGIVPIRFVIYSTPTGGTPLWQEIQNTKIDQQGHFDVMLGATASEGIPMELFASGEPRWLDIEPLLPGQQNDDARVLLVSVPYALQAENSQKLGGLPASAFARAAAAIEPSSNPNSPAPVNLVPATGANNGAVPATSAPQASSVPVTTTGGTTNALPKFSSPSSLANSQILDQNGMVTMQNLANILFADQFPGGVPAAISACPANGCVIYAVSPNVNLNLGNIDPGYKSVTIYLGPYTYTVNQVTLRKGLKIIGMGASGGVNGSVTCSVTAPCNGTALQSVNGNNPVFVIPQVNNQPATNVELSGFRLYGSVGNTSEDGFFLDTSSTLNTGLWNSVLNDVAILGFSGVGIHVKGRAADFASSCQWVLFNNVVALRTAGGGNALRLEGSVFQLRFRNCQFDGQGLGDGTNVYLGGYAGPGGGYPTTIVFEGLVSQGAGLAVQIDGGVNIVFYASHHESLLGGYQVTYNGMRTDGLTIADAYFAGNVGVNAGSGYLLSVATTNAAGIVFTHNHILGIPDSVVTSTNLASVVYQDNYGFFGTNNAPPTSGLTTQMSPAATLNVQGVHTVGLNPSTTPITTIQSGLGPGEMLTMFTVAGPVTFGAGGNIDLMGASTLTVNGTITLVRADLGGLLWKVVSQWSPIR